MNLQLKFDIDGNVQMPSLILCSRNGNKIGLLSNATALHLSDSLDSPEVSFDVFKQNNGKMTPFYQILLSFKLIYIPDFDTFFEAVVEEKETENGALKHVELTRLGEAELSQIHIYGLNVNTEDSIIYDENYKPTILYDEDDPEHSLLDRVLSYAPHYSVGYVAPTIRNIQRTFQFNDQTVLDCLKQIAEEESLFIILDSSQKYDGTINRTVSVYDVLSTCSDCGYRGFFTHTCPKCGGTNVIEGYGEDTTILVTSDALGNDLSLSTNPDSIANCYHLQAGDDLMTAAVRQCNPNGTGYIWNFTNEMLSEMSDDLREDIEDYNELYNEYMSSHEYMSTSPTDYNALIEKYKEIDEDLKVDTIENIIGYPALIKAWYDALDFYYFLKTSLMPSETTDDLTAQIVAQQLYTQMNNTTVAVGNVENISLAAASTAVMNNARLIANTIYEVTVQTQTLNGTVWTGSLMVQNFYNKDDKAVTQMMTVTVNDDIQGYVSGKVMKTLFNTTQGESTVVAMFNQTPEQVEENLIYYSLDELTNINKSFNGAIEVLSKFKADQPESEMYTPIYLPTKAKLDLVQAELQLREQELNLVSSFVNLMFDVYITGTQRALNFENFLGEQSWIELNSFRREANFSDNNYVSTTFRRRFSYTDSAYISDSLTNAEIVERAYEFLIQAEQKMAENNKYSYQINSSLKNLLVLEDFWRIQDQFECGNWIRVKTDSGEIYKLRLISFEMDFDNPESLTVSFSDISNTSNIRAAQQIIAQSVDMVKNPKKYINPVNTRFTSITDDLQCDYVYGDSFNKDNITVLGDDMTTTFDVLDGLIQGKIDSETAMTLIRQAIGSITLSVTNKGTYTPVIGPYEDDIDPSAMGWYEYDVVDNHYYPTEDTTPVSGKTYYIKESGTSSITIHYSDIEITSPDITLDGSVTFKSNLTDGTTMISGDNIQTGQIKSATYTWRTGEIYSDDGSLFDLIEGTIRTPGLFIGKDEDDHWILHIKDGAYIGGAQVITVNDGGGNLATIDHAHHAWKLRSAAVNEEEERYYTYMTANKNLVVSNSERGGLTDENNRTYDSSIGSYKHPWGKGYFNLLRVKHHDVLPEGLRVTLLGGEDNWTECLMEGGYIYYEQVHRINGMTGDVYLYIATEHDTSLEDVYRYRIEVDTLEENKVTFVASEVPPNDIPIVLLAEDYIMSSIEEPILHGSFDQDKNQLSCNWSSPRDSSKFITWLKDELIIEHCIDEEHPDDPASWEQVLVVPATGETPFEPDEFEDTPLIIGSESDE